MSFLNSVMRALLDAVLAPFQGMPAAVSLVLVSLVSAVFFLLLFKWTSSQRALERVKDQIYAGLFEIRLFNDDLRAILRATGRIFRYIPLYFGLSAITLLWLMPPFVVIVAHLQGYYGYAPLEPGQTVLLKAELSEAWPEDRRPGIELELPEGVRQASPGIWTPSTLEMVWRLEVVEEGEHELTLRLEGEEHAKSLSAREGVRRRSPVRPRPGFWNQLLFPWERPLPEDAMIESVSLGRERFPWPRPSEVALSYPHGTVSLLGWHSHWVIHYLILIIVFGYALKNRVGVTI